MKYRETGAKRAGTHTLVNGNNELESACHPTDAHGDVAHARDTLISLRCAPCSAPRTGAFHFQIHCYSPLGTAASPWTLLRSKRCESPWTDRLPEKSTNRTDHIQGFH